MENVIDLQAWKKSREGSSDEELQGLFKDLAAAEDAIAELRSVIKVRLGLEAEGAQ